jgi:hypothetical protein
MAAQVDDRLYVVKFADPVSVAQFTEELLAFVTTPDHLDAWRGGTQVLGPPLGLMIGPKAKNELYLTERALGAAKAAGLSAPVVGRASRTELGQFTTTVLSI